jgi:hypothetical protein
MCFHENFFASVRHLVYVADGRVTISQDLCCARDMQCKANQVGTISNEIEPEFFDHLVAGPGLWYL